jgi:hypothetical protein
MSGKATQDHRFGGPWTEIKLDAVQYYLQCYTNALSRTFMLWYIDGFARSGSRISKAVKGGLFERTPISVEHETLDGSARRPKGQHLGQQIGRLEGTNGR